MDTLGRDKPGVHGCVVGASLWPPDAGRFENKDLTTRQVIVLRPDQKTAQVLGTDPAAHPAPASAFAAPKMDATTSTPTGQSRTIDSAQCDECAEP